MIFKIKKYRYVTIATLLVPLLTTACTTTGMNKTNQHAPADDLFLISVEAQRAYRESRWVDAVRLYQSLAEHLPADAFVWFHLANTYAQQGSFQPAIHAYEQSLRFNNQQPKAWFNLSRVYLLSAQSAIRQSSAFMNESDPSRVMLDGHLRVINNLVNGRTE